MRHLQSKEMPLRTRQQFYTPSGRQKQREGIKIFPEKRTISHHLIAPPQQAQLPSVWNYLSGLNEAKDIPRIVGNKHEYYPFAKRCKRHQRLGLIKERKLENEQEEQKTSKKSRFETIMSSNPTNKSMMTFTYVNNQQKKINGDRREFRETRSLCKEEKQKQMRFSFYNTIEKSQFFLKRFQQEKILQERKTNNYQNMMARNITVESILGTLKKSKQKYKLGY